MRLKLLTGAVAMLVAVSALIAPAGAADAPRMTDGEKYDTSAECQDAADQKAASQDARCNYVPLVWSFSGGEKPISPVGGFWQLTYGPIPVA